MSTYTSLADAIDDCILTAGESISATLAFDDYPATTHTVKYFFRQELTHREATCSASGSNHVLAVAASITELWQTGRVLFSAIATNDSTDAAERCDYGVLDVHPNPAIVTHAQKVLMAIRAVIEGRASDDQLTVALGDVQLRNMTPKELSEWEGAYHDRVQAEMDRAAGMLGASNRRTIQTRFT